MRFLILCCRLLECIPENKILLIFYFIVCAFENFCLHNLALFCTATAASPAALYTGNAISHAHLIAGPGIQTRAAV